jgi:methionyl-tRNA formyltransferase
MRVGFAGTPAFAAAVLTAILDRGFEIPLVLTQPDRPQGRGLKLAASAVKALALARGLSVQQPIALKTEAARAPALAVTLDVLVVAAYGLILPPEVLAWPRHGCLNVHASLLPRWRGAAPIQRALLAGDTESGITIMGMDAGLDTGPIHDSVRVPVAPGETAGTLTAKLASAGAAAIVAALERLERDGALRGVPQPVEGASYAAKVTRMDAAIDWRRDAREIDRQVRAFDPAPGAFAAYAGEAVKIWTAESLPAPGAGAQPGTVVARDARGLVVACGQGALRVVELQPVGGKRMAASAFAAGRRIERGARFEPAPVDS